MRSHAIILKGTSLKERMELKEFLKSKNESVLESSAAFKTGNFETTTTYFGYRDYNKEWMASNCNFNAITIKDFIKKFSTSSQKRNLAFYKESGEPWTPEELRNICKYCGDDSTNTDYVTDPTAYKRKWVYDDGSSTAFMWMWQHQHFPSNYTYLSYESIFNEISQQPDICVGDRYNNSVGKLYIVEEIKSEDEETFKKYAAMVTTTSSELTQLKKETFMSKVKTTALTTIEQNKEAALVAAKMEAGRVLNKQIIKQLKPHVPLLLRGYLDTPLAPVILANAAALLGNHTGNAKVQKISELMLLAAADTTVQSFNLDKIIDDALAGIKLPAGILDADDN